MNGQKKGKTSLSTYKNCSVMELIFGFIFFFGGGTLVWVDITQMGSGFIALCAGFVCICGILLVSRFLEVKFGDENDQ